MVASHARSSPRQHPPEVELHERPTSHFSSPTDLIGRSAELRWLSRALHSARSGRPGVVLVVGEAGLGKSRLLLELSARARSDGVTVLSGRGEEGLVLPNRLLGDALRPGLEMLRAERPRDAELALSLLAGQGSPDLRAGPGDERDPVRWQAIQALESCIVAMARSRPLMICLDDLHWSDRPSLELLARILYASTEAARRSPLPLFIVCGSRPLEEAAPLWNSMSRLEREEGVRVLELGGLAPDSVAELMRAAGLSNGARRLATPVHELTRGNPLFVLEVMMKREPTP